WLADALEGRAASPVDRPVCLEEGARITGQDATSNRVLNVALVEHFGQEALTYLSKRSRLGERNEATKSRYALRIRMCVAQLGVAGTREPSSKLPRRPSYWSPSTKYSS